MRSMDVPIPLPTVKTTRLLVSPVIAELKRPDAMAALPIPVVALLEKYFGALSIFQFATLERLISESSTLTSQLSDFASNGGVINFSTGAVFGDFLYAPGPTINLIIPSLQSSSLPALNPFQAYGQPVGGIYDTVVGGIVGALAHELGHFENSVGPIYSMNSASNPIFTTTPTPANQAELAADALLSEGEAVYNNVVVAFQIASASDGADKIAFVGGFTSSQDNFNFEEKILSQPSPSIAIPMIADQYALTIPTGNSVTYLQKYWNQYAATNVPGLTDSMAKVTSVTIQTNSIGDATGLILHHNDSSAKGSDSIIDFSQPGVTTDKIINDNTGKYIFQIVNPANFKGVITNFVVGDTIDLIGTVATSASIDTNNVLTVQTGGDPLTFQLLQDITQNYSADTFVVTPDGNGGTDITVEQPIFINFQNYIGPSTFQAAGPEETLTIPTAIGDVIVSGGVVLTGETKLPADESSVYGTADTFDDVVADPSLTDGITIIFPQPITNFAVNLLNGFSGPGRSTSPTTYEISDNAGHSTIVSLPPNSQGGQALVSLPMAGTEVTISAISSLPDWDFSIDNILVNYNLQGPQTAKSDNIPAIVLSSWNADVGFSVAAIASAALSGQLDLIGVLAEFIGAGLSEYALQAFLDPFDPDYADEFFPTFENLPAGEADAPVPQNLANDANAAFTDGANAISYLQAIYVSLNRINSATQVGDQASISLQNVALDMYLTKASTALTTFGVALSTLVSDLNADKLDESISSQNVNSFLSSLQSGGFSALPQQEQALFSLFGFSSANDQDIVNNFRASPPAPCRHARRGAPGGPWSPRDNPFLRLREVSKGRELVEIVIALHDTLLGQAGVRRPNIGLEWTGPARRD
jgi:hypothetical protein